MFITGYRGKPKGKLFMLEKEPISEKVKKIDDQITEIHRRIHYIEDEINILRKLGVLTLNKANDIKNMLMEELDKFHSFKSQNLNCGEDYKKICYSLMHALTEKYR